MNKASTYLHKTALGQATLPIRNSNPWSTPNPMTDNQGGQPIQPQGYGVNMAPQDNNVPNDKKTMALPKKNPTNVLEAQQRTQSPPDWAMQMADNRSLMRVPSQDPSADWGRATVAAQDSGVQKGQSFVRNEVPAQARQMQQRSTRSQQTQAAPKQMSFEQWRQTRLPQIKAQQAATIANVRARAARGEGVTYNVPRPQSQPPTAQAIAARLDRGPNLARAQAQWQRQYDARRAAQRPSAQSVANIRRGPQANPNPIPQAPQVVARPLQVMRPMQQPQARPQTQPQAAMAPRRAPIRAEDPYSNMG